MSLSLSPEAIRALNALYAAVAPAATQPAAPAPATQGMPAPMAAFWASDYPGKGVAVRQLSNGRWADCKGAICKAPKAAPKTRKASVAPAAPTPAPKPAAPTLTWEQFAAKHPAAAADMPALLLGEVFQTGGSYTQLRVKVLGR